MHKQVNSNLQIRTLETQPIGMNIQPYSSVRIE